MDDKTPYTFSLTFPASFDYIPAIRKYVSEVLEVLHFTHKFAFRAEVVIDEVCHNAIMYGSQSVDAVIDLACCVYSDRLEIKVNDEGGNHVDVQNLKSAVDASNSEPVKGLGLKIVKLLSEDIQVSVGERNSTSVQIMKKK
jgi:anti-sigma regulatory factor (Ser/Thr protein kinase)